MYITVLHTVPVVFLLLFCFLKGKIITYFYELFMIIIFLLFLFLLFGTGEISIIFMSSLFQRFLMDSKYF